MYKIVKKTMTGKAHIKNGTECQDKIALYDSEGTFAVALADGAGSREDSGLLADAITKDISYFIAKEFDILYKNEKIKDILYDRIINIVKSFSDKGYDVACTLLVVAVKDSRFLSIHVGDGIIIGANSEKTQVVSEPENGNDLSETYMCEPLMDDEHIRIVEEKLKYDTLILTSDGIEPSLWNRSSGEIADAVPVMRKWMLECSVNQVEALVEDAMKNVFTANTNDDMSLSIINCIR